MREREQRLIERQREKCVSVYVGERTKGRGRELGLNNQHLDNTKWKDIVDE